MTIIAAAKHPDGSVAIGGDSYVGRGDDCGCWITETPKIWTIPLKINPMVPWVNWRRSNHD